MSEVWAIKHRPSFNTIVGESQLELVSYLQGITSTDDESTSLPHLLFHGPAGVGKTSMAHAFADHLDTTLHVFNASSKATRGIEFIEKELIPIARSGIDCIILLDEADQITKSAQMALKGVLENCSCTFILTCNNTSGLIDPLRSRCSVFAFKPINKTYAHIALSTILEAENIVLGDANTFILHAVLDAHEGDLRSMVNALQTYVSILREQGDQKALSFIENMQGSFSCDKFIQHINDKDFPMALKTMESVDDIRNTLNIIMAHTISKGANMNVVSHIVTAYRDLQFGMPEPIVKAGFCRSMVLSAPLYV